MHARALQVRSVTLGALAGVLALCSPVRAVTISSVSLPVEYRSWTIGAGLTGSETRLEQSHLPVTLHLGLSPALDWVTSWAGGRSDLGEAGAFSARLDGTSAVMTQMFWRLADDHLMLQTGVTVPSGKHALSVSDLAITQLTSLPVLGYGLKRYGRGLEWGAGATLAFPLASGAAVGSIGAGTVLRRPYQLMVEREDYQPASEFAVTGGAGLGPAGTGGRPLHLDATYRLFGKDRIGGQDLFEEGDQLELQARGRTGGEGLQTQAAVRAVLKGDNLAIAPADAAIGSLKSNSGNSVFARLRASRPVGRLRAGLAGEWDVTTGSDSFGRDGHAFGAGPTLDLPLGEQLRLQLDGEYLWGTLDGIAGSGSIALHGLALSANLLWVTR